MKTKTVRAFALLLAAMLFCAALAGCADTPDPAKDTTPTPTEEATPTEEEEEKRIELDLPDKDYGEEFHVLEWSANGLNEAGSGWIPWEEIDVDDYDGDTISSAVYVRNGEVEKKLGVEITKEYMSVDQGYYSTYKNDQIAEDHNYQMITYRTTGVVTFIQDGMLTDLNDYADDIFHFDQPWWVQDAVESFTLGDHLYVCASEILLRDKGATACVYYNQKIAKDYDSIPNFYDLVDNKQWTLEAMIDACEVVEASLDGDDLMNSADDMWGIVQGDDTVYYLFNGFGYKFAEIDETGHIEYLYGDDDSISVMKEIFDDVMYASWYYNTVRDTIPEGGSIFGSGNCLFNTNLVKNTLGLRTMEDDYGILPNPLYDDLQENYSSLVWMHHDCVLGMPLNPGDKEMCAMVIEALSWESYYTVYPKFYDTVLLDRSTRDADSKRMLQIVFETRSYDPGQFWDNDTGLHGGDGLLRWTKTGNSDIMSMWEKYSDAVDTCFQKVNDWIDDNE